MAQSVSINDKLYNVDLDDDTPMLWVLRDACELTGTKYGCGIALCGACTIHVDGAARRSCVTPLANIGAAKVRTIEALHETVVGRALQRAWRELEVPQCGYCQSGQLMSAAVLLETNPAPSDAQIDAVMAGNLCRCGTYGRIRAGIKLAGTFLSEASP
ncbi:MAG TPA: (2Fe-2S)-binding protein [Steroidobacter sp.]